MSTSTGRRSRAPPQRFGEEDAATVVAASQIDAFGVDAGQRPAVAGRPGKGARIDVDRIAVIGIHVVERGLLGRGKLFDVGRGQRPVRPRSSR